MYVDWSLILFSDTSSLGGCLSSNYKNKINKKIKIRPNFKSIFRLKIIKRKNKNENIRKNRNVLLSSLPKFKCTIGNTIIPPTNKILAILLPTRLPATIPSEFNFRAWKVAANSGREVPIAIIKIPTNISLILKTLEIAIEFLMA